MKNPKISIIIPTYNAEQYVADAIQSALDQTVKPHEVIVINDGSTDRSLEVIKSFDIKIIDQTNRGLSSARNSGIAMATGDYILPLDSDDMLLENALELVIAKIEETDADIIGLSFKCFGAGNTEIILADGLTLEAFKPANRIAYCSAVKRSALLECGGYSTRMAASSPGHPEVRWQGYEDYFLWFDLLKRGKTISVIEDICFLYRTRNPDKEKSMIHEAIAHHDELMAQINNDLHIYD
jgi:glycosyltransferase involved in cell wall biosynthesis